MDRPNTSNSDGCLPLIAFFVLLFLVTGINNHVNTQQKQIDELKARVEALETRENK